MDIDDKKEKKTCRHIIGYGADRGSGAYGEFYKLFYIDAIDIPIIFWEDISTYFHYCPRCGKELKLLDNFISKQGGDAT